MNNTILKIEDVTKLYNRGSETVHALDKVSLSIDKGDYISIVGPSGSGKTTLLNIAGCMDRPTSGTVFINETEISSFSEKNLAIIRRDTIGFVFQQFFLIPTLTVRENIELPLLFSKKKSDSATTKAVLESVGLSHRANHLPAQHEKSRFRKYRQNPFTETYPD